MIQMNHCTRPLLPLLLPQTGTSGRVRPLRFSPLSVLLSTLLSGVSQRGFRLLWSQFPNTSGGSFCVSGWSEAGAAPPRRNDSAVKSSADGEAAAGSRSVNSSVMPSNVEIKARVSDAAQFAERAGQLSQSEGTIIRQHDTFFNCGRGRLKLRDFMDGSGQLIFYERPDTDGPKLSRYSISQTSDPPGLRAVLSDALGVKGEVRKERRLFLIGQTRVHLDAVEGLGDYMELEVVMRPDQSVEDGQQVAQGLMEQLGVSQESLVTGAYMDLLLKGRTEQ